MAKNDTSFGFGIPVDNDEPAPLKPFEVWAAEKKTPDWLLAATKASQDWPIGREMTEAAFDAGVERGLNLKMLPS